MFCTVDDLQISYRLSGEGEQTLVILQGWGTEWKVYDSIAAQLASRFRVLQFDFPGFGHSQEPAEPWNVDAYADFFCKLMLELGIDSAILMGHSYGGRVIIKLAARESLPFTIESIVLVDAAGVMPKRSLVQKLRVRKYKLVRAIFNVDFIYWLFPEIIDDWRSRQGSADYRAATPIMRQALVMAVNEDLQALFPKVQQEVLLIWGAGDTATPLSDGQCMEQLMPNAGLVTLQNAGHFSFLDQPAAFARVLASYFNLTGE